MVKCELTELQLLEIISLDHSVETIYSKNHSDQDDCDLSKHNIEADFEIQNNDDQINIFRVIFVLKITPFASLPGYRISSKVEAYFSVPLCENESDINDSKKKYSRSSIAIVISYLRAYLKTLTYNCPYGKYTLPAINLPKLFNDVIFVDKESDDS